LSSVANYKKEDDTIVLDDESLCVLLSSGGVPHNGDTRTLTEATEDDEIQPEDDTPQVSTRSRRPSFRNKNSDFFLY